MTINNFIRNATSLFFITVFLSACSSAPKSNIPVSSNLNDEVERIDSQIAEGAKNHYDVLANSDYQKSVDRLKKAKKQMEDDYNRQDVLETLSEAEGYYERATETSEQRGQQVQGILEAREAALQAGARKSPSESKTLRKIDDDLRDEVQDDDNIETDDFNNLLSRYLQVEKSAVETSEIGNARSKIKAVTETAKDQAPRTLDRARKDLANAKNSISANVRNPSGYKRAVSKANKSAQFLTDVVAATEQGGEIIPESVAVDLVTKGRVNRSQQSRLSDQQNSLQQTQEMRQISKNFAKDEAEVYRQGNNVLIRLKGMKFSSGRAELPGDSVALLAKVRNAASSLNAQQIVVEGHTDAVGSASINKTLSQKRAEAVAQYLTANGVDRSSVRAVGRSFEQPITTNKTKIGRAMNRRVDVIITPDNSQNEDDSTEDNSTVE